MNTRITTAILVIGLLGLAPSACQAGVLLADLSITKENGVSTAVPGTQVVYTLVVANAGPSDAPNTTVNDSFPAPLSCSWTCTASAGSLCSPSGSGDIADVITLDDGGTATYTATCQIDAAATGSLANTATVTEDDSISDNDQTNNSATDVDTLAPTADLSIEKSSAGIAQPGTPLEYAIVVENNGPSAVSDATVADTFPAGLEDCGWTSTASGGATGNTNAEGNLEDTLEMPVGSRVVYDVTCQVEPAAAGTIENTATVDSTTAVDPNSTDNASTDVVEVQVEVPRPVPVLSPVTIALLVVLFGLLAARFLRRNAFGA